jgi:hypothetical protein
MALPNDPSEELTIEIRRLSSLLDALERRLWFIDAFCESLVEQRFRAVWRASFEVERERILSYQERLREFDRHPRLRRRALRSEGLDGSALDLKMELAAASFDVTVNTGTNAIRVTVGEVMGVSYSHDSGMFELQEESQVKGRWNRLRNSIDRFPERIVEALRKSGDLADSVVDSALDVVPGGGAVKEAIRLGSKILNRGAD